MTDGRTKGTEMNETQFGPEDPAGSQELPEGENGPKKKNSPMNLYVGGVVAFLGYEILLVLGLASMLDFGSVGTTFLVVLLSVPGYFMLGYLSESLLALPASMIPALISLAIDLPEASSLLGGESVSFFVAWSVLSILLLPLCLLGVSVANSRRIDRQ
jgi:hypothetical protein